MLNGFNKAKIEQLTNKRKRYQTSMYDKVQYSPVQLSVIIQQYFPDSYGLFFAPAEDVDMKSDSRNSDDYM